MASGEIRLSGTTMRRMPVLAQSQSGGSTVWADGNGGFSDVTPGVTVTANSKSISSSESESTGMSLAGAGSAGIEAKWGEQWLGTNGRVYNKFWANGTGRTVSIRGLTKIGGIYFLAAGTFSDLQSLQDGEISQGQFYTNFGLGMIGLAAPAFAIGVTPAILINSIYPGGFPAYQDTWTDEFGMPYRGGYDGLR